MSKEKFTLIFKSQTLIAPDVRHLTFEREDGQPFHFIPGQFIHLHFEYQGEVLQRSYSLANVPGSPQVELAISYVTDGRASDFLFGLQPGDRLEASGPYGRLILRDEAPKRYIFVATGTGVTPYRAMLQQLSQRMADNPSLEVVILLGGRTQDLLLYAPEFLAFASAHPRAQFIGCCSRENPSSNDTYLRKGYVQDQFEALALNPENDIIFLCGNPDMIDAAYAKLTEKGFGAAHVRREKYVFSH